jgi:hypothetical protein
MDLKNKETLFPVIGLALAAVLTLVGGIIGKTVLGWILFAAGLLLAAAVIVWRLKVLKDLFASSRLPVLIGGGVLALMVVTGLVVMLVSSDAAQPGPAAGGSTPPPMAATTAVTAVPATETPVPSSTATVEPTAEPTTTPVGPIYVCLNENTQVGYSMRIAPRGDALFGGQLQWGACFTVDGQAAGVPGWYHVTRGQEGSTIGLSIDVDENKYQLWVDGYYLESFGEDLTTLPEITVIEN